MRLSLIDFNGTKLKVLHSRNKIYAVFSKDMTKLNVGLTRSLTYKALKNIISSEICTVFCNIYCYDLLIFKHNMRGNPTNECIGLILSIGKVEQLTYDFEHIRNVYILSQLDI